MFGKRSEFKKKVVNQILHGTKPQFALIGNGFSKGENSTFKVVLSPDPFDPGCQNHVIDFMALCYPGPSLFVLTIDPRNKTGDDALDQINKLQKIFGDHITKHLAVVTEDYHSLDFLKDMFPLQLATASIKLARDCQKWCCDLQPFLYDFCSVVTRVVLKRRDELKTGRYKVCLCV